MRVLFIHNRYKYYGGEDVAVAMEAEILQAHGHTTDTLIFDNDEIGGLVSKIKTGIGAIYNKRSAAILRLRISEFKPDLIHVHNLFFVASPAILTEARKQGIPLVLTLHNYRLICANALLLRENKICELCINKVFPADGIRYKCYRNSAKDSALVTAVTSIHKSIGTWRNKADKYIVLTEFAKNKFLNSSLNVPDHKFIVKPNCVHDTGPGSPEREEQYLFVGRLSVEKGVRVALEAFRLLPQLRLVIAGDGPDQVALIREFGHLPNIEFKGKQDKPEIVQLMKTSKALIFPSIWYEGLPFTIVESFAAGTPVITSGLGAMQNMIKDGFNGFHFQPGDANDLVQKVSSYQARKDHNELNLNARKTYENHYHPDIHYKSVMKIYSDVIKNYQN